MDSRLRGNDLKFPEQETKPGAVQLGPSIDNPEFYFVKRIHIVERT